jgi:pSer/pThr/pTyr-binding forkhead associated (FHA) protein
MTNSASVALERTGPAGLASCVYPSRFPFVIGRGRDCDLRLFDPALSRRHCVLELRDGRLTVEDLDTRNGTEVNGGRITGPRPLADGDLLWVGGEVFTVRLHAGAAAGVPRSHEPYARP